MLHLASGFYFFYDFYMLLSTLLQHIFPIPDQVDCEITQLNLDSRRIQPNNLFVAIRGTQLDGRKYIADAIARGAKAVLFEAEKPNQRIEWQSNIPLIPIFHLQSQLGEIAGRFYNYSVKHLRMIGVTGTNGKTSCTHFIAQSLKSLEIPCGIIGTLGHGFYGALGEVGLTTPDVITLQAILHDFYKQGAKSVAMEVSSHSIDQGRVNGIDFELGIFTNLTQDHLDYHGDMATYAAVKHRFLAELPTKQVIINADDSFGNAWMNDIAQHKSVFAYGVNASKRYSNLNVPLIYADQVELTFEGIKAVLHSPWGSEKLWIPLIGIFNLSNALAVFTTLCAYGIPFHDALACLANLKPVAGRMQKLGGNGQPLAVVDYAHSPDALEKVLQALRAHTEGKLICVFGCGGERDHGKRPLMAKIAEAFADTIIVTNDNPRHEKPEEIADQIVRGFAHPERVVVILDRSKAIKNSIEWANAKDCVLIAGKGAEHYQQIGDVKIPFDDVEQVSRFLNANK